MSNPEDGTTDFPVGSLRDLLEGEETPAKGGGGGGKNQQMAIIGGAVAAVVVLVVVFLLVSGGSDDNSNAPEGAIPAGVELKPSAAVGVTEGGTASICDTASGPIAEGVLVKDMKSGKSQLGQEIVTLEVLAPPEAVNALGQKPKSTWKAIASATCPPTATTSPPATEPTTDTTPATTPPDSVPTPPPSG
jgi:hypothetical protein